MSNQITPNPSVPSQIVQEVKFPKFVNNLGIIPTSYKDSMSYYECLAWLCKYLEETVIPTVNENGEAVEELQGLYIELNSYVTNYFENLDVQEEINNKLDVMAEDGTLSELLRPFTDSFNEQLQDVQETVNLHTSQIANLVAQNNDTEGNSELIDIRVSNNGEVYTSAGDSVRAQIDYVESLIEINREALQNGYYRSEFKIASEFFELGGINQTTGVNINANVFARTKNFITFDELVGFLAITNLNNLQTFLYKYDLNDTFLSFTETTHIEVQNIAPVYKYKFVLGNSNQEITNISQFVAQFHFYITSFIKRENEIYNIDEENLLNPDFFQTNVYPRPNGEYSWIDNFGYSSQVVPVEPNTQYYTDNPFQFTGFLDENKALIGNIHSQPNNNALTSPFTTPANCYYVVISKQNSAIGVTAYLSKTLGYKEYGNLSVSVKDNVNQNKRISNLKNKKIACFGDSISSVDYTLPNWCQIIANRTGAQMLDYGISGTTLAHTNDRHLWDYGFTELDASEIGYVSSNPATWTTGNCFCERWRKVDTTVDGIVIMGGTNDSSVPIGAWNSEDTTTFFGALNVLFTNILKTLGGKKVLICTPIQTAGSYDSNVENPQKALEQATQNQSVSLQLRAEAIIEKCKQYGLPVLDLYNHSGINGVDTNKVYYRENDTLHPSSVGQERLACLIESKLEELY